MKQKLSAILFVMLIFMPIRSSQAMNRSQNDIATATQNSNHTDPNVRRVALEGFEKLVKNNQGLEEAITAAHQNINRGLFFEREAPLKLLKTIIIHSNKTLDITLKTVKISLKRIDPKNKAFDTIENPNSLDPKKLKDIFITILKNSDSNDFQVKSILAALLINLIPQKKPFNHYDILNKISEIDEEEVHSINKLLAFAQTIINEERDNNYQLKLVGLNLLETLISEGFHLHSLKITLSQ